MLELSREQDQAVRIDMFLSREIARDAQTGDCLKVGEGFSKGANGKTYTLFLRVNGGTVDYWTRRFRARSTEEALNKANELQAKVR